MKIGNNNLFLIDQRKTYDIQTNKSLAYGAMVEADLNATQLDEKIGTSQSNFS